MAVACSAHRLLALLLLLPATAALAAGGPRSRGPRLAFPRVAPPLPPVRLPKWQSNADDASVALAVQRLAVRDAERCLDECVVQGEVLQPIRIQQSLTKLSDWLKSREKLIFWATTKYIEAHVPAILPFIAAQPLRTESLTLSEALAPVRPWHLTREALFAAPRRTFAFLLHFTILWAMRVRSADLDARARRRRRALTELARAYDALR